LGIIVRHTSQDTEVESWKRKI